LVQSCASSAQQISRSEVPHKYKKVKQDSKNV